MAATASTSHWVRVRLFPGALDDDSMRVSVQRLGAFSIIVFRRGSAKLILIYAAEDLRIGFGRNDFFRQRRRARADSLFNARGERETFSIAARLSDGTDLDRARHQGAGACGL